MDRLASRQRSRHRGRLRRSAQPAALVQRATEIRIRASGDHAASGFEPPLKLLHTGDFANNEQMWDWDFEMCGQWCCLRLQLWRTTAENGLRVLPVTLLV